METLGESAEPPEYSFFSSTTAGLELSSSVGLEEGVEAPPEEDYFKSPSNELDNSFGFDSFYDGGQQFRHDTSSQLQPVLFVSDLEKQLQSASLKGQSPSALTVTEVENQQNRRRPINETTQLYTTHANFVHQGMNSFPITSATSSNTMTTMTAGMIGTGITLGLGHSESNTSANSGAGIFQFPNTSSTYGLNSEFNIQQQQQQQQQLQIGSLESSSQHSISGFPPFQSTGSVTTMANTGATSLSGFGNMSGISFGSGTAGAGAGAGAGGGGVFQSLNFIQDGRLTGFGNASFVRQPMAPIPTSGVQKYKFMTSSEIEKILSSQVQNIHVQNPYSDDYYYHAFIKKYRRGSCRFTPVSFKEAEQHQEQAMKAEVKFADLQGLGKIPFSNLRTPRPLIDFLDNESLASAEEDEALHSIQWEFIRSAHRQQAMQARKLIEDSMCLLLEVDDVDRLATSECSKVDLRKLASKRRDLIGSIVEAFRIPSTPEGNITSPTNTGKYVINSDGVFLRLMSIAKGRSLLAKLLNVLVPPRPFQALPTDTNPLSHICWTTLRNIRALFGPPTWITKQGIDVDVASLTAETSKIAAGLKEVILALRSANDVCRAFEALAKGDLMSSDGSVVTPEDMLLPFLPPNHIPGKKIGLWLEQVLVALCQRALEVGLAQRICFTHPTGAFIDFELMMKWDEVFGVLYEALTAHLKILGQVQLVAKERNQPQALQYADGLRGRELLKAALTLCNQFQLFKLKQLVSALL